MQKFSGLAGWLARKTPLPGYSVLNERVPDAEAGGFVGIDIATPVHEVHALTAESLSGSWHAVRAYVNEACKIIGSDEPGWLDREEVTMIKEGLGDPPPQAYPIYFISAGSGADERLVYIGKTSAKKSRFQGGHAALARLHAPKYDGLKKTLYMGTIVLLDDIDYLPIEWISPLEKAERLLSAIEAQLIFDFQPELNTHHRDRFNAEWQTPINIENHSGFSEFLHGEASYGPAGVPAKTPIWSADARSPPATDSAFTVFRSRNA